MVAVRGKLAEPERVLPPHLGPLAAQPNVANLPSVNCCTALCGRATGRTGWTESSRASRSMRLGGACRGSTISTACGRSSHPETIVRGMNGQASARSAPALLRIVEQQLKSKGVQPPRRPDGLPDPPMLDA